MDLIGSQVPLSIQVLELESLKKNLHLHHSSFVDLSDVQGY
jgi:hypothetical protein